MSIMTWHTRFIELFFSPRRYSHELTKYSMAKMQCGDDERPCLPQHLSTHVLYFDVYQSHISTLRYEFFSCIISHKYYCNFNSKH